MPLALHGVVHPFPLPPATLVSFPRRPEADDPSDVTAPAPQMPVTARETERALLDAWREAHWSLRLELRRIAHQPGVPRVEALYDAARRADNRLHDFHQARVEVLLRQLRDLAADQPEPRTASDARPASGSRTEPVPSLAERALVARFRAMSDEDRSALMRMAVQLASRTSSDG